jgi:Ca-activated chloride channel family protein
VPLTDDSATIEQLLRALTVELLPISGDTAASALRASVQLLAAAKSRAAHVILLSDGISDPADSISAARQLSKAGAQLSVIGIGTAREAQLRELARSGGGVYQPLGARGPHPALTMQAVAGFSQAPGREASVDLWVEKGVWLLLPMLLLAALGYRRGWLAVVVVVALCPMPQQVMAVSWDELWLTPDQRAKRLLDAGQADQAAELFTDPNWRATARYRSGDFDQAAAQFAESGAAYNRANALAKAGKLTEALDSYEQALTIRPDDGDARFNRDLVQKILDEQQQEKKEGSENKPHDGESPDAKSGDSSSAQQQNEKQREQDGSKSQDGQQVGDANEQQKSASSASQEGAQPDASPREAEQQQAKKDVEPQQAPASGAQRDLADGETLDKGQDKAGVETNRLNEQPPSEQELALQQWLRQVPDDPGGLLRRKFMLEHLRRRKERNEQ